MKKFLAVILCIATVSAVLVGCGASTENDNGESLKIAIVSSPSGVDDEGFNQNNYNGILDFVEANPEAKPLFHSDRGFQYTSKAFRAKLQQQGMDQSMSRVGHCIDNDPKWV